MGTAAQTHLLKSVIRKIFFWYPCISSHIRYLPVGILYWISYFPHFFSFAACL
jgi:hypothetical protein